MTREGSGYRVVIGDRVYAVDLERFGEAGRSLIIDGAQHEVMVHASGDGRYQVSSARGLDVVGVVDPLTHLARQTQGDEAASGAGRTVAYMPGRVVGLLVEEGQAVEAGQGVVVLEAMKMENEIPAERDGVLRRFFAEVGQVVESGDALFEVD